jgi:hypothetical protein
MNYEIITSPLLKAFNEQYDFLYDNGDNVPGYTGALAWFDENSTKKEYKYLVDAIVRERGDFIASDREAVAFALALELLGIIK